MGIFIIIIVLIFEVVFMAYCIKTKDNQNKARSLVSIVAFLIFIGLIRHLLGGVASAQLGREREDISAVINLDGSMLGEYSINGNGNIVINE